MAFTLVAYDTENNYTQGFVVNMTAGAPYTLESFEDAGPAEVARFSQSSPDQHGATDLGFRLQPRTFVAKIHFVDGDDFEGGVYGDNRAWLFSVFRPSHDLFLRLTRDDGEVRILRCHTQQIEIELLPEHYPARLNRATITLRAASPLWYTAAQKSASYAGTSTWWTGNGAIGTANIMERVAYPSQGQPWTYAGTITGAWSIVYRSGSVAHPGAGSIAAIFHAGTSYLGTTDLTNADVRVFAAPNSTWLMGDAFAFAGGGGGNSAMPSGTIGYALVADGAGATRHYRDNTLMTQASHNQDISGTARRWRSDRAGSAATYFAGELPYVAVYDIALSAAQRAAVAAAMAYSGTATETGTVTAVNAGDVTEYPLITVRGPIANPVLTNTATGDVLGFTGLNLTPSQQLTIDLRTGLKTVYDAGGSNYAGYVGTPAQLASFGLAPAPTAGGGTNLITVTGGSMTSETLVTVYHYDRHVSF